MTWTFERFGWDAEHDRPLVAVQPLAAPGSVVVRIVALGADDDQADTMFALKDGNDRVKEAFRPEPMQLVFLEGMLAADDDDDVGCYTLDVGTAGRTVRYVAEPTIRPIITAIERAETGYIVDGDVECEW